MSDQAPNNQSSGEGQGAAAPAAAAPPTSDNATSTEPVFALSQELGPNGLPIHPTQGDPGESVDSNFLMDTFFGDGTAPVPKSGEGQGQGSNSSDGQPKPGSLAPPQAAPAANGGEGSPQPGPSSTPQQPGEQQAGEGGAAPQTPGQAQPGASPAQEPPAQTGLSVEDRLRLASADALARQNAELIERLRRLEGGQPPAPGATSQPPAQPGGQGAQPADANQPGVPRPEEQVRLVVPDELYARIMSDDPAQSREALSLLITGVAQNAVKAAIAAVPAMIDQRVQTFQQTQEATRQMQTMEEKYFEAFPAHNNPIFRELIQSVVQEKYQQFPNAPWESDMINAVGATVNGKLTALGINPTQLQTNGSGQQGDGQQNSNGSGAQPAPRPQPAPMLDSRTRGGQGGVPQDAGDFIKNTFG